MKLMANNNNEIEKLIIRANIESKHLDVEIKQNFSSLIDSSLL